MTSDKKLIEAIGKKLETTAGALQRVESLDGARNPTDSESECHEMVLALRLALSFSEELRGRYWKRRPAGSVAR